MRKNYFKIVLQYIVIGGLMAEIVINVPEDIKRKMESFPEVNWSQKLQEIISEELKRQMLISTANKVFSRSELNEKDALELGEKVKDALHKRFKKEHPEEYP